MGAPKRKQLTPTELKALLAAVRRGEPYIAIGIRFGLKAPAVQKLAHKHGVYRLARTRPEPFCVDREATAKEIEEVESRKEEIDAIRLKGVVPDLARPKGHIAKYVPRIYESPIPPEEEEIWFEDVQDSMECNESAIEGEEIPPRSWRDDTDRNSWMFKGKR